MPGVVKNKDVQKTGAVKNKKKEKKGSDGEKVKKKKSVSCLQCIKPSKHEDREEPKEPVKENGGSEGKYRVAAPELMQDTFMSDSEDEGGEVECPIQQQQQYRYMNNEVSTLHRARPLEDSVTDGHLWPSNNDRKMATIDRQPLDIGFLVSFVVDARGGAMRAKRRGGVRIIVPPAACAAPTRVTCRAATRRAPAAAPPPLMEGEALASRLLELQPQGAKFLAPVIIEVPIFTSSCREREIVILRSDTGETWQDHYLHNSDNLLIQEALAKERADNGGSGESLGENGERVTRIVTADFPHYLAVVSRVRQDVHVIGPDGGTVSSTAIPQVQALFPPQALTKRIRVGLQAHGPDPALVSRVLPRRACVTPVLTVEPRRRKFHRSITLTAPLPSSQGVIAERPAAGTMSLRLLCSIMGGQARAVWEDVTGSTPLSLTATTASFTTTVSARFWLMNCQNIGDATKLATELYKEMLLVPFDVRIVVLGKRLDSLEGRLLVLYITDRYNYDTLIKQEHYTEVAASTAVRLLDGKNIYLEFSGNLVPVTKSGTQPTLNFEAFKDNRVEFPVRVKHREENPTGRIYFMNEPKVAKGEQSQNPACVLDVELPDKMAPRAGKSQLDCLNLDQSGFDALNDELSFNWEHNSSGPASLPPQYNGQVNGHHKIVANGDVTNQTPPADVDVTETKPPAVQNGDSTHVDSNKTKATFDSDEDKTPGSTLEKNKKKPEAPTSFLGGLADKVKHVFVHSEDEEDKEKSKQEKKDKSKEEKSKKKEKGSKNGSPKISPPKDEPPPKPDRQSPPKPSPRLINEDILEKVDDVFKDLREKPKQDNDYEDVIVQNQDYAAKLVNEAKKAEEMYKDAVPVEEEPCVKKKVTRRRQEAQDEFENLVGKMNDEVNVKEEQLDNFGKDLENDFKDGVEFVKKEKDNLQNKTDEISQDVVDKYENAKDNLSDKVQHLENSAEDKFKDVSKSLNAAKNNLTALQSDVVGRVESGKTAAQDNYDDFNDSLHKAKDVLTEKVDDIHKDIEHNVQDTKSLVKDNIKNQSDNLKDLGNEATYTVTESVQNIQDSFNDKFTDFNNKAYGKGEEAKERLEDNFDQFKDSVECTKNDVQSELKDKKVKSQNFFTGLVDNIFGEKEKLDEQINEKVSHGKDSANEFLQDVSNRKDDFESEIAQKQQKIHDDFDDFRQKVGDKRDDVQNRLQDAKTDIEDSAQSHMDRIRHEAELATDEIKRTAEETINAVADKKTEVVNKTEAVIKSGEDEYNQAVSKLAEVEESSKEALDSVQDSALSSFDKFERSAKEKTSDAQDAWEDLQSSTKDTFADFKDDVHGLESSTQDTLHSFQSSAGNTFDSLDDSAKELVSGVQSASSNANDFFGEVNDSVQSDFEGFKVSADNKLEDVKGGVKEVIHDAGDTLEKSRVSAANSVNDGADAVQRETDKFTANLNNLGNDVFGAASGFMSKADASTKLLNSEKSQQSPSPNKKGSGIPKLKKKKK